MRETGAQLHAHRHTRTRQIQHERERGRERLRIKQALRLCFLGTAQLAACRVHPHNAHRLTGGVQQLTVHIVGHIPRIHARLRAELKVLRRKRSRQRVQLHRNHGTAVRRIHGRVRRNTAPQISHRAGNRAQTLSAIMRNHRAGRLLRRLLGQHEDAGALAELGTRTGASLRQRNNLRGLLGAETARTQGGDSTERIRAQRVELIGCRERFGAERQLSGVSKRGGRHAPHFTGWHATGASQVCLPEPRRNTRTAQLFAQRSPCGETPRQRGAFLDRKHR